MQVPICKIEIQDLLVSMAPTLAKSLFQFEILSELCDIGFKTLFILKYHFIDRFYKIKKVPGKFL